MVKGYVIIIFIDFDKWSSKKWRIKHYDKTFRGFGVIGEICRQWWSTLNQVKNLFIDDGWRPVDGWIFYVRPLEPVHGRNHPRSLQFCLLTAWGQEAIRVKTRKKLTRVRTLDRLMKTLASSALIKKGFWQGKTDLWYTTFSPISLFSFNPETLLQSASVRPRTLGKG